MSKEKEQRYRELVKRIQREKDLHVIQQKMEVKKNLMVSWQFICQSDDQDS